MSKEDKFITGSIESGETNVSINSTQDTQMLISDENDECIGKSICSCCLLALIAPCVVCDLFFALTDKTCVNENVENINLKQYLLGSGIFTLLFVLINIICIFSISNRISNRKSTADELCEVFIFIVKILGTLFTIIWNIIGAVIFWGTIYKENICSNQVTTYLFVILILRLLSIYGFIQQQNYKK